MAFEDEEERTEGEFNIHSLNGLILRRFRCVCVTWV